MHDADLTTKDRRPATIITNLIRGALIGTVETVPGVSGGTVALVVGLYERLIGAASEMMTSLKLILKGVLTKDHRIRMEGIQLLKKQPWVLLGSVIIGMVIAVATMAHLMSHLVETHPILTSAAFFGMVLASLYVPYSFTGSWRARDWIFSLIAAVLMYFVVSQPPAADLSSPPWFIIVLAAAVAVSALLLPGLSGSFLLLTFGLYETTMQAVKGFDLGYLGFFALGALIGLATVVKGLEWLLKHHHHLTLVVLTGVMLGALRALWPWTSDRNELLPVGEQAGAAMVWALVGFALVLVVIIADVLVKKSRVTAQN